MRRAVGWAGVIAGIMCGIAIFDAPAQVPAFPEFEVAEVRIAQAGKAGSEVIYETNAAGQLAQIRLDGASAQVTPVFGRNGQVTMRDATMRQLIAAAYKGVIRDDYLAGEPRWLDSDRFDLIAKAPSDTSLDTERLMIQGVLAKRFHLQAHWENRPMPIYAL